MTQRAPCANSNLSALQIIFGTAGGPPQFSSVSRDMLLPEIPIKSGQIIPNFHHNLMGIGKLCDHNYRVLFEKISVTVFPMITLSSSVAGENPLVPISSASPLSPNSIPPLQQNGVLLPRLSMPMISPVLDHLSVTSMLSPDSP